MLARTTLATALALATAACQGPPDRADGGVADAALADAGPRRLSTAGLYTDIATFTLNPRAIEFTPASILWSDGAQKRRWIILPPGGVVDSSDMNHWKFPVGTQFFKEFSLGGRRLETRLVEHVADTGDREKDYWLGAFAWQDDGKDAVFVAEGRDNVLGTDHDVPTADQCWKCHIGEPGHVLGFQAVQLSQSDGFNLTELSAAGLLSNPPPVGTLYPPPGDAVTSAALGYLHANCGHCHNPYGSAWQDSAQVLRLSVEERDPATTQLYQTTVGVLTMQWMPGRVKRIAPGDPAASAIFLRMGMRGDANQMPPLATEHIDPTGISKVEAWILVPPEVNMRARWFAICLLMLPAARALADDTAPDGGTPDAAPAAPQALPEPLPPPAPEPAPDLEARLKALEDKNADLADKVDQLTDDVAWHQQQLDKLAPLQSRFTGYIDFGFFTVTGNGAGTRSDVGNTYFPEYAGVVPDTWVFMGDPLLTAINARGEPADTGESRAITFNSVKSGGKPSFILNTLSLALFAGVGKHATFNAAVDFLPRGRDASDPSGLFLGDYLDVKLGYVEYRIPTHSMDISLFAGKFDSVLGYEYRSQDAPDRLSVTPSLICRYTCGHPLGLKARFRLPEDRVVLNVAVTNGSSFQEQFPFSDEIDVNRWKTVSGRLSFRQPMSDGSLELGASGAFGAQDLQPSDTVYQWHLGGDLHLEWKDLELTGEFVKGKAQGQTDPGGVHCGVAPCIHYQGAYGLLGYKLTNTWEPYVRTDYRDAVHQAGASFVYISKLLRVTAGVRAEVGSQVVLKAEYTVNRELGRIPQFPDDIFTSALIVKF